jgi:hypothetical protein
VRCIKKNRPEDYGKTIVNYAYMEDGQIPFFAVKEFQSNP